MCGIAGVLQFKNNKEVLLNLEKVLDKQIKRGPDAGQIYLNNEMALGHRRLKIFDLSDLGMQPMVDSQLGLALVFNGAIYNFKELRKELKYKGYSFSSTSDTEVLLKAYHAWGRECVQRLEGMFAFAIWEQNTGQLILARDRLGIKPLYYTENADGFKFASTLPALLKFGGVDTQIDKIALHYYLTFHAVPEPLTILKGVRKLPPATVMTVYPNGKKEEKIYWSLTINDKHTEQAHGEKYWIDKASHVLSSSIQRQMMADVPVGILLSGGLDSSLLVAMASKFKNQSLQTFSIGFESTPTQEGDEFFYSNLVSSTFNTKHHQLYISNKELASSLDGCISSMSEPMLSHDNIGFYLLSKEVAKYVKVVISGQGADEIFAGYHWFQNIKLKMASPTLSAQIIFNRVADRTYGEYKNLVVPDYHTDFHALPFLKSLCQKNSTNPTDNLIKYESTFALANGPLSRVDNMTMAYSLEARVPFLDERMLHLASSIPLRYKLPQGGKYILKQLGKQILPKQIIERPKGYFPVPALKHFEGRTLAMMQEILSYDSLKKRGLFNPQAVQNLFPNSKKNFTPTGVSKLWQIGLLEYWLQRHI